jgi:hypothetical protein
VTVPGAGRIAGWAEVLGWLRDHPGATTPAIAAATGKDRHRVLLILRTAEKEGRARRWRDRDPGPWRWAAISVTAAAGARALRHAMARDGHLPAAVAPLDDGQLALLADAADRVALAARAELGWREAVLYPNSDDQPPLERP